ncbi:MAG: type IVB secretion system protein IcmV [Legionella sp.]
MKKHPESRIIKGITRVIKVRQWFDWDRVMAFTLYLGNGFKRMFVPRQETDVESFDEAMKKLELTDESILVKQRSLFRLSIVMVVVACLILIYAGYQLFMGSIKAFILSLIVTMIALILAFRYHFWYFQMKQRKLGCTLDEWYRQGLLGEKK